MVETNEASQGADSLFADWMAGRGDLAALGLEQLCERFPRHAQAFRELHERVVRIDRLLGPLDSGAGAAAATDLPPLSEFLDRLRARRASAARYEERAELGRGGMGQVLEVYDVDLRRAVAKKVALPQRGFTDAPPSVDSTWLARFCEEAQVTAQLTHPGVVPVHELGLDAEGRVYFTMDVVRGRTLGEVFRLAREGRDGWTLARAVGVIERVCETLAFAHSRGVLHRDVKPGNVMVGEYGEVYVMDWGLAKLVGEERAEEDAISTERRDASDRDLLAGLRTETGAAAGTPGFMAPEQARGELRALDERTDVYAVGALLYCLLGGEKPFADEVRAGDLVALLKAMQHGAPRALRELAPDAPAELVSICERAMAPRPERRYATALELAADLRAWLEGRVVTAHEQGAWAELRKWVGRNRGLAGALAGVVLAISAGVAGMAVFERQKRVGIEHQQLVAEISAAPTQAMGLLAEAETLWPSYPETAPGLRRWLAGERALRERRALLEEGLAAFRGEASRFEAAEFDPALEAPLEESLTSFSALGEKAQWVRSRLALAESVDERTLFGADARAAWAEAIEAVAASPAYGGLVLAPQRGLLPLREDPQSHLWEFWHVLSGERPELDLETDAWAMAPETGVVLVLVPAQDALVGSIFADEMQARYEDRMERYNDWLRRKEELEKKAIDPAERERLGEELEAEYIAMAAEPSVDPFWSDDFSTSDPVTWPAHLEPFFISKYELTRGQWWRTRHEHMDGRATGPELRPENLVSWDDASRAVANLDLELPTEAQWELAARGGRSSVFATGNSWSDLIGHAVLLPDRDSDHELDLEEGAVLPVFGLPWNSDFENVGRTCPTPYGLHEIHGNLWEWCRDVYEPSSAPEPGDGLRTPTNPDSPKRVMRGGSYSTAWDNSRLSSRFVWERQNREPDTGLRPARPLRSLEELALDLDLEQAELLPRLAAVSSGVPVPPAADRR